MKSNKKFKFTFTDVWIISLVTLIGITILYPFYNSVLVSLVPQSEYIKSPFMLYPKKIDLSAYKYVFESSTILSGFFVSVINTIVGTLYSMLLITTTAYALTKPFPGRRFVYILLIIPGYFSGGMIPSYLLIRSLRLIDSIWALILPTGIIFGYLIIIMHFFDTMLIELEESAKLDGASDILILFKIVLPLSLPILATYSLYCGVARWNDWFSGVLYIRSANKIPLQTVLRNIIQESSTASLQNPDGETLSLFTDGVKMACLVVTMMPIICLYPLLQRYFIQGLKTGAVKS